MLNIARLTSALTLLSALACGNSGGVSNENGTTATGGNSGATTATSTGTSNTATSGAATSAGSNGTGAGSTSGATAGSASGSTSGGASSSGFSIAAHNPLEELSSQGGPELTPLDIVTIRYADAQLDLGGYAAVLLASNWLAEVGTEYGISAGQHLGNYVIPDAGPAAAADSDVQLLIEGLIDAGLVPAPTSGNTVYAIEYPVETTVTLAAGETSCVQFGGYHDFDTNGGFPYAVIVNCTPSMDAQSGWTDVAGYDEFSASHEFLEAATDPLPNTRPAYAFSEFSFTDVPWLLAGLGELADLCSFAPPVLLDAGIYATRIWSNAAADAGLSDPCVPAPADETYYNVSASLQADAGGPGFPPNLALATSGLAQPQVFTFDLTGWSTQPTSDWYVYAVATGGTFMPQVALSGATAMGFATINNGQTLTLTVTVPANTPTNSYAGVLVLSGEAIPYANTAALEVVVQ